MLAARARFLAHPARNLPFLAAQRVFLRFWARAQREPSVKIAFCARARARGDPLLASTPRRGRGVGRRGQAWAWRGPRPRPRLGDDNI